MNILVIEDEKSLSNVLVALLEHSGYAVDAVGDGIAGEDCAMSGRYDLVLLDIMLPGRDGLSVLRALRQAGVSTPVLLLTAKAEVEDKISGLDTGADDYLTKPFATGELLARVRAMTRRKGEYQGDVLSMGQTSLNRDTHELCSAASRVKLGMKEYQIMEMLLQNSGIIVQRERLVERVWGYDADAEYNTVEVYVSFLRRKLRAIDADIGIRAVRGVGYTLEAGA